MRRVAVLIAAALLFAGCDASAPARISQPGARLCIDVGFPLSGAHGRVGRDLLAGLEMEIPATGIRIGEQRVALCQVVDDSGGDSAILAHAASAAQARRTIAYVGGLSGSQVTVAEAVLGQAGIALLSPSAPGPSPTLTLPSPGAGQPTRSRSTGFSLLPSAQAQSDAIAEVRSAERCGRRRRGRPLCTVFSATAAPLCTGIPSVGSRTRPRYCVTAGPDLSRWRSPAVAYGAAIGRLLLRSLQGIASAGGDIANRASVLAKLRHTDERRSPIGPIRFGAQGGTEADLFAAYTVGVDGRLVLSRTLRTH